MVWPARSVALLGTAAALIATTPAPASAQVTQLTVTNLASPARPSEVPQPPLVLTSRGSCATPLTEPDPCPVGTWPAVFDGNWGPWLAVAGGDLLELAFDAPVDGVLMGSTSTLQPGTIDPSGQPVSNADAIPGIAATRVDATHWTVQLPEVINARLINGLTLSAVASDAEPHDFALKLVTPRPLRYGGACDDNIYFWFRPDLETSGCPVKGPPPGMGPNATPTPTATPAPTATPTQVAITPALKASARWTKRGLSLSVVLPAQTAATVEVRAGKVLLGRTKLKASRSTKRTVVVPVRATNRHRHARTLRVTLAAAGLQRVETTLKATRWPRLRVG